MNTLCILASPNKTSSISRNVADRLLEKLKHVNESTKVHTRDLADAPPPHWGEREATAALLPAEKRTSEQTKLLALSDSLCSELKSVHTLVIATPMWNFGVPSVLKAWVDHIVRAGITFQYGQNGPKGLLQNLKNVYLVEATGGVYLENPATPMNHVGPYLKHLFQWLGAENIITITAPGTAINSDAALNSAMSQLEQIFK